MQTVIRTTMALCLFISVGNTIAAETVNTAAEKTVESGFTAMEKLLIKNYLDINAPQPASTGIVYNNATLKKMQETPLHPALTKKKELPPGVFAQLQRNGTLPSGLVKHSLPDELEKQLPPVHAGYERTILEDMTVVLVETATKRIVDIIFDPDTKEANSQ